MTSPAARRYAKALFLLGVEENRLDGLVREFRSLADTIASSAELRQLLSDPVIAPATRKAVMNDIVTRLGFTTNARNAALLLTDRRRGALIPAITDALSALADERAGKLQAEVTSAAPLAEAQYTRLIAVLEKLTGHKITLKRNVDPALVGGVVTRIGDKVFDGSVRNRLEEIRQSAHLPS